MNNLIGQEPWELRGANDARIRALETKLALIDTGIWTDYTPVVTQLGVVTKTIAYARYQRVGRKITVNFFLTLTGAGTTNNILTISLPVTAASANGVNGSGRYYDASAFQSYGGSWVGTTTTTVVFVGDWSGTQAWGVIPLLPIQSDDIISGVIIYEAAS